MDEFDRWWDDEAGMWVVLADEYDRLRAEVAEKDKRIEELMQIVMAVETKHPGEKRWETALRYVMEAENRPCGTAKSEVSDE